jgi:hypothetical protein
MRVGYCFSIFRFLFIIFVYYNISFTLPRVIHQYGNADKQVSQYGGYDYNNAYLNNHTNKNGNLDNANH